MRKLFPYQEIVFEEAKKHKRLALFLQQRLGKTIITIRWLKHHKLRRTLIVCPKSVIPVWETEILQEAINPHKFPLYLLTNKNRKYHHVFSQFTGWIVTNYEECVNGNLFQYPWDCVVLDESTYIRKNKTKRIQYFDTINKDVPEYRAILSGLPNPESTLDYFNQFKFLDGEFLGHENYYGFAGALTYKFGGHSTIRPASKRTVDNFIKERAICLTREEAGIDNQKLYSTRFCDFEKENRDVYNLIEQQYVLGEKETEWAIVVQGWLHQYAGGLTKSYDEGFPPILYSPHKLNALLDILNEEEYKNQKILICARFVGELKVISKKLDKLKKPHSLLIGAVDVPERARICNHFQTGNLQYILAQPKVLRFGLNLSACNNMIYFSNSWENEDRQQSEDRLVHPEKKEPIQYIDLVTRNSIDEDIVDALHRKRMFSKLPQTFNNMVLDRFKQRVLANIEKK